MQLTFLCRLLPATMAASLAGAACATDVSFAKPTLVEVWAGGDDGLTQRLSDAIENAFQASPDFALSRGKKPGTLIVTIPANVGWKQIGGRIEVRYTVEFASAEDQKFGNSVGSCWDDSLAECASRILDDARIAARKIR